MKVTAFLTAFAGLGFVAASPIPTPTDHSMNFVRALLRRGTELHWDPYTAYRTQPKRKRIWEETCEKVLTDQGCATAVIHQGERKTRNNDKKTAYVNVEGTWPELEIPKQMRVYLDGTSQDGWSHEEREVIRLGKRRKVVKKPEPRKPTKALFVWSPPEAYEDHRRANKSTWEQKCDEAFESIGCKIGILHQGVIKTVRNGRKTSYVNVEGAPMADLENWKRSHGFKEGSSSKDGLTKEDLKAMPDLRRNLRKFRVFKDGSAKDVTDHGWTIKDRKSMSNPIRKKIAKHPKAAAEPPFVASPFHAEPSQPPERESSRPTSGKQSKPLLIDLNEEFSLPFDASPTASSSPSALQSLRPPSSPQSRPTLMLFPTVPEPPKQ